MPVSLLCSCRLAAVRLALAAAAGLLAPQVARGAAESIDAADAGRCGAILARLAERGRDLGYDLRADVPGLAGARDASKFEATCDEARVAIEVVEDGGRVSVDFSAERSEFGIAIAGQFAEFGRVRHTSFFESSAERPGGSLRFAADTGDAAAFVEFDLEGAVLAAEGDAASVNERLTPVLAASTAWKDAHALTFALADLQAPAVDAAVPVPSPRWGGVKKSVIGQAFACGTATITCTAAAAGFVPAAGSCVHAAGGCALAVACSIASCLD